jgi:3'-phosphoadenosine 5'-phosphosulfate sulfotransferase (PAPS reductase)/FAD synthetase
VRHIVGVSGGKDSVALALRLREVEPETDWEYLITPTGDELPPMLEHWSNLERLLGKSFIRVSAQTLNGLIQIHSALPNFRQRWCTRQLKIEPTIAWCVRNAPVINHVGLRADEEEREGIYGELVQSRFPFREWGWGITEVRSYLAERGITIPKRTDCARCYHQRLSEWRDLWRDYPEIYADAVAQEARMGHTFRSPGRDTWPSSLAELAAEFERGRPIRGDGKQGEICRVCSL